MSAADKTLDEMLEVIESICRYNEEVTMYEVMTLRQIGYTITALKMATDDIKELLV